jgi:hypothetical protein
MRKAAAVRDALRRARPHARDPLALLRVAGGTDLAALAGVLVQAAVRRTPVLLDGLVVGAAALVADALAPGAKEWWLVAQRSPEPAMALVTTHLVLPPLLDLRIRAGDGTGALTVLPLLQMAARLVAETAVAEPEPAPEPVTPEPVAPEPTAPEPTEPEAAVDAPTPAAALEPTTPATPAADVAGITAVVVVDAPAPAAAPAGAEVPDAPAPHGSSAGPGPAGPPRA